MRRGLLNSLYKRKGLFLIALAIVNCLLVYRTGFITSSKNEHGKSSTLREMTTIKQVHHDREKSEAAHSLQNISKGKWINLTTESTDEDCFLPGIIHDGVPYPNCIDKIQWMKGGWKTDPCYANHGVSDDVCSMIRYLSHLERHCPKIGKHEVTLEPLYLNEERAVARKSFGHLLRELGNITELEWIKSRIRLMQNSWLSSAQELYSSESELRAKKRIHLHLGIRKRKSGSFAELVQWSDLISALYSLGHNIVITRVKEELNFVYDEYLNQWNIECPTPNSGQNQNIPFDLIYTDRLGYAELSSVFTGNKIDGIRCRLRILERYGVEAEFNALNSKKGVKENKKYIELGLNLRQFQTMYPHTPDNTFLGFATEAPKVNAGNDAEKRNIALIYGNDGKMLKGKEKILELIKQYLPEIHTTMAEVSDLPSYIKNHGLLSPTDYFKLLQKTKVLIGLGTPLEGPAPLEAIQNGAIFLNPRFSVPLSGENNDILRERPTTRQLSSQNPYSEKYIGMPKVYTLDIDNEIVLRTALINITKNEATATASVPFEFTVKGMLQRVSVLVERQQFCTTIPYSNMPSDYLKRYWWPPLSSLQVAMTEKSSGRSCNDACEEKGWICDPSFFSVLNSEKVFHRFKMSLSCDNIMMAIKSDWSHPAYDPDTKTCHLQTNSLFFSCSAKSAPLQRICPCRVYQKGQIALPKNY